MYIFTANYNSKYYSLHLYFPLLNADSDNKQHFEKKASLYKSLLNKRS